MSKFSQTSTSSIAHAVTLALLTSGAAGTALAETDDPNPYAMSDASWITLSGEIEAVDRDSFTLDYGDGSVIVEMDDGDRDADAYTLMSGDEVTVSGRIDDDFLETTSIEASSVYIKDLGTTFFASAVDEETSERMAAAIVTPVDVSYAEIQGVVAEVDDEEFTLRADSKEIRVEVDDMDYNPLDDEGYQRIRPGDRVRVAGEIENDLFEDLEIEAQSVIKLDM